MPFSWARQRDGARERGAGEREGRSSAGGLLIHARLGSERVEREQPAMELGRYSDRGQGRPGFAPSLLELSFFFYFSTFPFYFSVSIFLLQ